MTGMTGAARAEDERIRLEKRFEVLMKMLEGRPEPIPRMTVSGTELVVGSHRIKVSPVSEQVLQEKGNFFSAARFEIALDGHQQDQLTGSSIGIASSADEATSIAVEDWYMQYGSALILSVSGSKPDFVSGAFRVNRGPLGIRGTAPADTPSTPAFDAQKVLAAISSSLPVADTKFHAVHIFVAIEPGRPATAECRIDGRVSAAAAKILQAMTWPAGSYIYKQSYVLK